MLATVIGAITSLGGRYFQHRSEKTEAKHQKELAVITGERSADVSSSDDMKSSLKDEYLTLILSVPVIVIFYSAVWGDPQQIEQVKTAFSAMNELPEFYKWCFMGCVAATFGIRSIKTFGK